MLIGQDLSLLPLRTQDEQQGTKPLTAFADPSGVATNLMYLDSPRKVTSSFIYMNQNRQFCCWHEASEIKYDYAL